MNDLPSDRQSIKVLFGEECPYCGGKTEYVDSIEVYGHTSYGMVFLCRPCKAWVGVHHKTSRVALGRIANKELRQLKMRAHEAFDALWRMSKRKNKRQNAYAWLSKQLNIEREVCHIGMFNAEQCRMVLRVCGELREKVSTKPK